jgi:hypothetical protein
MSLVQAGSILKPPEPVGCSPAGAETPDCGESGVGPRTDGHSGSDVPPPVRVQPNFRTEARLATEAYRQWLGTAYSSSGQSCELLTTPSVA